MVILKLSGGVGNQLFQYAAGRALALRLQTELVFDANYYLYVRNRHYILDQFRITGRRMSPIETLWREKLGDSIVFQEKKYYQYDSHFGKIHGNVILDGWWQNPMYFLSYWDTIHKELRFQNNHPRKLSANAVSVHVRRGDYTKLTGFGVCSPAYYQAAAARIRKKITHPRFYIFSDDPEWAKANLPVFADATFVTEQSELDDLTLMSQCHHHILANSTFSWWGTMLAKSRKGITIAPSPWVDHAPAASRSLYQKGWIILKRN